MRIELLYWGPGHINWSPRRAFGTLDRASVVTYYCGLFAVRIWRY